MLLSHANRRRRVSILTLDDVLAEDIAQRLGESLSRGAQIIQPHPSGNGIAPKDIEAIAPDTVTAAVIIFDVRSLTLPLVQRIYNKAVGYNRRDFNERCFSLVIGDGPSHLLQGGTLGTFANHLARFRVDYSPSAYFFDPFLHYDPHEKPSGLDQESRLMDQVPLRLLEGFQGDVKSVGQIRRYFRAAAQPADRRASKRNDRTEALMKFFASRLAKAFPDEPQYIDALLSQNGLKLGDETLGVHLYPLHFESCVEDLLTRAEV